MLAARLTAALRRLTIALAASALALAPSCGGSKRKEEPAERREAATPAPAAPAEPAPDDEHAADVHAAGDSGGRPRREGVRRLRLTLRSTPSGAEVAVDGRTVGRTPVIHEVPADGREHEFTFLLPGHDMERYRMIPVRDGVVHATLKPLRADAGPE